MSPKKSNLSSRGGKRPGSGRKPTLPKGAVPKAIKMTDAELVKVKEYLKTIRSEEK